MDFCTSYFGKPLTELSYDDIHNYFSEPRIENATIEFKSFHERSTLDAGLKGVIKGICSFLNSEGGILVWGAPEGTTPVGGKEDVFVGELRPVSELVEKDRLINRISSEITRLPIGIKVQILTNGSGYLYVFEIQESQTKPHQFGDRYYIRLDGQSRPAPHYVVEALMRQITYPNLSGYITFSNLAQQFDFPNNIEIEISVGVFNLTELQNEEAVSIRVICAGGYFPHGKLLLKKEPPRYTRDATELIYENFANVLHFGSPTAHDNILVCNAHTLRKTKGLVELWLEFGGRKSPAKMSYYVLDFTGIQFGRGMGLPHPHSLLVKCEENLSTVESMRKLNVSVEDSIRSFTKR